MRQETTMHFACDMDSDPVDTTPADLDGTRRAILTGERIGQRAADTAALYGDVLEEPLTREGVQDMALTNLPYAFPGESEQWHRVAAMAAGRTFAARSLVNA